MRFCGVVVVIILSVVAESQTADCEYGSKNFWNHGIETGISYYSCGLKTTPADFINNIKKIDGQHLSGYVDNYVKYVEFLYDKRVKNFSSILCQKFSNLETVKVAYSNVEFVHEKLFENCRNLQNLDIDNSKVREISEDFLTQNSKLLRIWWNKNRLTTLPEKTFQQQKELKILELQENQINFLPNSIFRSLSKLETLLLSDNKLQSINPEWFKNLQNLQWLRLDNNQITEIPSKCFKSLRSLEKLWLYSNSIRSLKYDNFHGLYNLQSLNLRENQISDLPVGVFSQLKNLLGFNIAKNNLTTIHSDSFSNHWLLTEIRLQDNKINSVDERFFDQSPVSYINMTNNICSHFDVQVRYKIKKLLQKCFDNYEPRVQENLNLEQNDTDSCGKPKSGHGNIIGGKFTKRGDFPWNAALTLLDGQFFCGGTLVSNRKVITAAHCIQDKGLKYPLLASQMLILLGMYNLNNNFEPGRGNFTVQNINMHPDWNPDAESFDADIAVLILENAAIFSSNIQPICLPDSNIKDIKRGYVVGYGKSEDDTKVHENIPKIIEVPIHKNEDCFLFEYLLARLSSKRTFCGGTGSGTGVCNGDSGSGLIVSDGSAYYLRAVVSSSLLNANRECNVDSYSVFTDVTKYVEWINDVGGNLI